MGLEQVEEEMMTEDSVAVLTIKGAAEMSPERRRDVARWLRRNADFLTKQGDNLDKRFRARYILTEAADA